MNSIKNYLCRDINGKVHIISKSKIIQRTSVYGLIIDNGKLLLVRDRSSRAIWDLPGGGVEDGESLVQALSREIMEETGLTIDIEQLPKEICSFVEYFYDVDSNMAWESTRYFYLIKCKGKIRYGGNDDDIIDLNYFPLPLNEKNTASTIQAVLSKF